MQFNIATIFALAGAASAAPQIQSRQTITTDDVFGLVALRSGSPVHFQSLQAQQSSFLSGLPSQNASCDVAGENFASFTLSSDGALSLYSTSAPYQEAFVDASGMGQGVWRYTTGAEPMVANGQRTAFYLDESNDLYFNNHSFIACPYLNGSYSFSVDVGSATPFGNEDCLSVSLRAVKSSTPVGCLYTS
ncbi:cell wall protein PhiA [Coniella lustricola]|uniref:Cell wall protein PhiA n=1 Tax=Coniella lustricola TaxID=2025994 RepID=A0A2T2ZZE2_9PEZI|nr:cell wall protein PhiA [Coniella lustricola]